MLLPVLEPTHRLFQGLVEQLRILRIIPKAGVKRGAFDLPKAPTHIEHPGTPRSSFEGLLWGGWVSKIGLHPLDR
jgi:hypothetical protein